MERRQASAIRISRVEEDEKNGEGDDNQETGGKMRVPRQLWQQRLDQVIPDTRLMDELVMNFLIHEGYKEGALKFARESGTSAQIDTGSIDARILIR